MPCKVIEQWLSELLAETIRLLIWCSTKCCIWLLFTGLTCFSSTFRKRPRLNEELTEACKEILTELGVAVKKKVAKYDITWLCPILYCIRYLFFITINFFLLKPVALKSVKAVAGKIFRESVVARLFKSNDSQKFMNAKNNFLQFVTANAFKMFY